MKRIFLIFLLVFSNAYAIFGPKKFYKSPDGNYWCRDRINHPGRQCCEAVRPESINATPVYAKKTSVSKVGIAYDTGTVIDRGYGEKCDLHCVCKVNEVACKLAADCKKLGKGFSCKDHQCQFACKIDKDCLDEFGSGYGCQKGYCARLKIMKKK